MKIISNFTIILKYVLPGSCAIFKTRFSSSWELCGEVYGRRRKGSCADEKTVF